jgi:hypothetical protein
LKQDSGAIFLFATLLTLLVTNLMLFALYVSGVFPFDAADLVGVSVFDVLLWSFAWRSARRRSKSHQTPQIVS